MTALKALIAIILGEPRAPYKRVGAKAQMVRQNVAEARRTMDKTCTRPDLLGPRHTGRPRHS